MKQFLTVVAVGVLGAVLLVACGGDKKEANTGGTGAGGETSATAPASTDSAAPAASSAPAP
jgi:hypothetical protein